MARVGEGFGQGFAQTILTLGPLIEQNQRKREELDLQKKLAAASLAKHEAETQLITQQLLGQAGLREALTQGVVGEGPVAEGQYGPGAPTRQPLDMGDPAHQQAMMPHLFAADPSGFNALMAEQMKAGRQGRAFAQMGSLVQQFMGGGTPSAPQAPQVGPSAPTPPGAGSPPPVAGAPTGLGPIADNDVALTIDKDGNPALTFKRGQAQWKIEDKAITLPDGRTQLVRFWIDPIQGVVRAQEPMGAPAYPQQLQQYTAVAQSFGLDPTSPAYSAAVADIARVAMLPPDQQTPAMAALAKKYQGLRSTAPGKASGTTIEDEAMADARTEKVLTEVATTKAKIETELATKPLEGAAKEKYVALEAIQRQGARALELFRPEFVGKPFVDKFKGEFAKAERLKDYTPGALAGAMREALGNATPDEVEFRRTVLEIADNALRARSGAAISENEYKRVVAFVAALSDEPRTFKAAMARVVKETTAQMESAVKIATTPASKLAPRASSPVKPNFRYDPAQNRLVPVP